MKILDVNWQEFAEPLDRYGRLPQDARRVFVEKVVPSQALPNAHMGEWREALLDSGLMVSGVKGVNATVDPRFRQFHKVIRALHRVPVFNSPTRDSFHAYVREHFTDDELAALCNLRYSSYYYDYDAQGKLYSKICSAGWLKRFLAAKSPDWEKPFQARGVQPFILSMEVLHATQMLIKTLSKEASPVRLAQLPGMLPELPPAVLDAAIRPATRYLLAFPGLIGPDLVPALGLWPRLASKISGHRRQPPAPVSVDQEFCSPILMEDMATILTACAATPLRVRAGDRQIFDADRRELENALGSIPAWVAKEFPRDLERTSLAHAFLEHHGFIELEGERGRDLSLRITRSGAGWLESLAKDRLKSILERLRAAPRRLLPETSDLDSREHLDAIVEALFEACASVPEGGFVRLREFLAFRKETNNPLILLWREKRARLWIADEYLSDRTEEELEDLWERMLSDVLLLRLIPLGAVKLGRDSSGAFCFGLSPAGNYFVGTAADFDLRDEQPGHILVQPNFDVVFLSPSSRAEIEISRFSERKGRGVGCLLKVTKASIQAAAAAGFTAERVLGTLREHCATALPANVEMEVHAWFRQYRQISYRETTLIHCPDAETAGRVLAATGNKAVRLNDTVLEWTKGSMPASLTKKLREMGIYVRR